MYINSTESSKVEPSIPVDNAASIASWGANVKDVVCIRQGSKERKWGRSTGLPILEIPRTVHSKNEVDNRAISRRNGGAEGSWCMTTSGTHCIVIFIDTIIDDGTTS